MTRNAMPNKPRRAPFGAYFFGRLHPDLEVVRRASEMRDPARRRLHWLLRRGCTNGGGAG
jgi:hypothetical protein